jgi:very-short-patch-repair endonuclease
MSTSEVTHTIDGLARRQHGVLSRRQALDAGMTRQAVETLVSSGRWVLLAPAVYGLRSHPVTWEQRLMAAVLGEPEAAVGGRSAAALHGLTGFKRGRPEIVVPRAAQNRSAIALVRRRDGVETTRVAGLPVLTVRDTLFAVAGLVPVRTLVPALDDALGDRLVTVEQLQGRYLELAPSRRRGFALMQRLIEARSYDAFVPPASALERLLYGVLDRPGMPRYQAQAALPWAPDKRVDAMLLEAPVIVEGDGRRWHTRVADFERDRERDRAAALHGYRTLRYTWNDLRRESDRVASEIRVVGTFEPAEPVQTCQERGVGRAG